MPLSDGCVFASQLGELVDRVGGGSITLAGAASVVSTPGGLGINIPSAGSLASLPFPAALTGIGTDVTIYLDIDIDIGTAEPFGKLLCIAATADSSWALPFVALTVSRENATNDLEFAIGNGVNIVATFSGVWAQVATGSRVRLTVVRSGATVTVYIQDVQVAQTTSYSTAVPNFSGLAPLTFGARKPALPTGEQTFGDWSACIIWSRALSAGEVAEVVAGGVNAVIPPPGGASLIAQERSTFRFVPGRVWGRVN